MAFDDCPIKKEDDPRLTVLPKKVVMTPISRRSRFVKPKPNIGSIVNKLPRDAIASDCKSKVEGKIEPNENTVIDKDKELESPEKPSIDPQLCESESIIRILEFSEEPTPAIKEETDSFPRLPPKRAVIPTTGPRARFQKARPNVSGLSNKALKNNPLREERSSTTPKNGILSEEIQSEAGKEVQETETDSSVTSIAGKNIAFSFSYGIVEVPRVEGGEVNPEDTQQMTKEEHNTINMEELEIAGSPPSLSGPIDHKFQNKLVEIDWSKETTVAEPMTEQQIENESETVMERQEIEQPSTNAQEATSDTDICNEDPVISPVVSKGPEYPTLKSILNSPRKRTVTKRVHEKKRRLANLPENPSRSEMTMTDLIYWNPSTSPMKTSKPLTTPVENLPSDENCEPPSITEEPHEEENENASAPVPKVIINENGEIILDESSLFVRRKETIDKTIEAIVENDNTTYSSFRKRSAKQWTTKETAKFYKALSLVGTDFALMENIFTIDGKATRSRRELKLKFKREEKQNTELVHRAMYDSQTYDVSILDDDTEDQMFEVDNPPPKKGRKRNTSGTQNKNTGKRKNILMPAEEVSSENNLTAENDAPQEIEIALTTANEIPTDWNSPVRNDEILVETLIGIPRIQRTKTTKDMSDYITNVDDLSDAEEIYVQREWIKKNSEDCTAAEETECGSLQLPKKHDATIIKRKRTPKIVFTEDSVPDVFPEIEFETSRSGRIRRNKVMPDFITLDVSNDANSNSEEDDIIQSEKRHRMQIISEDSADDSVCVKETAGLEVDPNGTFEALSSVSIERNFSDKEGNPDVICLSSQNTSIDNLLKPADSNSISIGNILTNAEISEVITSDKPLTRRIKKKPALIFAGRRHIAEIKHQFAHPPSFTNFTPTEEVDPHFVPEINTKTYSKTSEISPVRTFDGKPVVHKMMQQAFASPLQGNSFHTPKHTTEDAPIMIMTRSPHNENILHLFMVNSPSH